MKHYIAFFGLALGAAFASCSDDPTKDIKPVTPQDSTTVPVDSSKKDSVLVPINTGVFGAILGCRLVSIADSATNRLTDQMTYDSQKRPLTAMVGTDATQQQYIYAYSGNTVIYGPKKSDGTPDTSQACNIATLEGSHVSTYQTRSKKQDGDTTRYLVTTQRYSYDNAGLPLAMDLTQTVRSVPGNTKYYVSHTDYTIQNGLIMSANRVVTRNELGGESINTHSTFTYGNTPTVKGNPAISVSPMPGFVVNTGSKVPVSSTRSFTYPDGTGYSQTSTYSATINDQGMATKLVTQTSVDGSSLRGTTSMSYAYECN